MKQVRIYLGILLSILISVACSDDLGLNSSLSQNVREGIPVEVQLDINSAEAGQVEITRATNQEDGLIYDLFVLIFNSERHLKTVFYGTYLSNLASTRTLNISTTSGPSYIFAIANVNNGVPAEYNVSELAAKLKSLNVTLDENFTIDDLKELTIGLAEQNVDIINRTQARYVLSGKFSPSSGYDQGDGYCVIPDTNAKKLEGMVPLYRTDAKITFNLYTQGTNGVFTPRTFRVVNVPLHTRVMNEAEDFDGNASISGEAGNYYTISEDDAINVVTEGEDENQNEYRTFTFYMPENRKVSKKEVSSYNDREKQVKESVGENKVQNGGWVYAPDYGTYVVLSGSFEQTDGTINANVQYKIHLGNFSGDDWGNFKTSRNTSYIYNVHVNGVDNIIVEVKTDEENQPGATGDVYYTTETNLYTLDAHYETCLMTFSSTQLAEYNKKGQINYLVNTPFTDLGAEKASDAAWVQFRVNEKNGGNYSDNLRSYSSTDVMDIEEFIGTLQSLAANESDERWDGNKEYKVTCFINEYYYSNDKNESGWIEQYATPEGAQIDNSVPAWKYAVNKPNRKLQILCDIRSSADGESAIINAAYVLSQRSIQTFYNTDVSVTGLKSAIGLETVNETGSLPMGTPGTKPTDLRDGLSNTIAMWGVDSYRSLGWSTYINSSLNGYSAPDKQKSGYNGLLVQSAYLACLQRNRDDNGNGKIDKEEVKWYMPALNQYAAFFIGEDALSQESRFYTSSKWEFMHYYSSTYATRDDIKDVMTVWAEEGFSNSTATQADKWYNDANKRTTGIGNRYYRCVRNLGNIKGNSAVGNRPQNYWYKDDNTIYFTYLAPAALRQVPVTSGELDNKHTERSNSNRMYKAFAIAKTDAGTCTGEKARSVSSTLCATFTEGGVSSGKWRVPNQRELLFMTLNGKKGTGDLTNFPQITYSWEERGYHCRTLFTWSSVFGTYISPLDGGKRYGYEVVPNGNMSISNDGNNSYYVRCVRDIVE